MDKKENENKDIRYTKFGWVDLSNLAKTKGGNISWKNSIGCKIPFKYQSVQSEITIKQHLDNQKMVVDIDSHKQNIEILESQIVKNQMGVYIGIIRRDFKYNIGDIVNNLKILNYFKKKEQTTIRKYYRVRCLIDGYEFDAYENNLSKGFGCPVCSNKIVVKGVNDIATTKPDVAKYFLNVEDTYTHTMRSGDKVDFKCPLCGDVSNHRIADITKRGFSCRACGDFASYPNKFVYCFLKQLFLLEDIKPEHRFDWSLNVPTSFKPEGKTMIYDEYIPMFNMIIENHGSQHYKERNSFGNNATFEEIQENDRAKKQTAIDNGIYYYIELDCRKSEMDHIKNSIMDSELPNILGFSEQDVDWMKCHEYASGSLLVESVNLWNSGISSLKEIAKTLGIGKTTVHTYIQRAKELNLLTTPYPLPKSTPKQSTSQAS